MIFQNENLLYLLLLVPIAVWWILRFYKLRARSRNKFADDKLWRIIAPSERKWVPLARTILIALALACLLLALARPKGGEIEMESTSEGIDIYLILDMSKSMIVEDVGASRFIVQKKVSEAIVKSHPHDRIGIIGFTGEPYVICPLTLDHGTLLTFLDGVRIDRSSSSPGTGYGDAVTLALTRFEGEHGRAIVLFTDGENNKGSTPTKAAREALRDGVRIYAIGIGTEEGTRLFERDFFNRLIPRSYKNQPVIVKLDKSTLKKIADITHGKAFFIEKLSDANAVFLKFDRSSKAEFKSGLMTRKEELAHWFLAIAALLLIADFLVDRFRLIPRGDPQKLWLTNNNKKKRESN
ncbi:VWA domain-containing protein [bacterium]|nr:VWA domain-containing protein [bacterium]